MDVIICYTKNDRIKRLTDIEFVEFDAILKRFFYWERGKTKGESVDLKLVKYIKVNQKDQTGPGG